MKFWYNPNFLAGCALLILSIPALKSLQVPGFYTSHDGETHTARIAAYYQALADGQFPPRYAGTFYGGFGSPIFVYIYPLPYLAGSAVHFFGFSFTDSFEILMAVAFIFSAIFSYLWLKEVFKSEKAAFLGALFYVWVPYRFLIIYVRGSISEHLAYTFLPLVFYSLTKLRQKPNILWMALGAISFSLVLLSQNLVALVSAPFIGAYILILGFYTKSPKYLLKSTISIIWGFAIVSVTYLPSFFEIKYVRFDETIKSAYDSHFVTLKQLIRSPWGYGFDLSGTVNDQMSFQIGLAHLLILILAILLIVYFLLQRTNLTKRVQPLHFILSLFFLAGFIFSVFMMLEIKPTKLVWQNLKFLNLIDIPWRFLGVAVLALSFLAAFVAKSLKSGSLFLFLVIAVLIANRNHLRINKTQIFDDNHFKQYLGHATQYSEFTPIWRQTDKVPIDFDPEMRAQIISGQANIIDIFSKSNEVSFNAEVRSQSAQIRISKFYFPGVGITVDNKGIKPQEIGKDASGLILIRLEKGNHKVSVNFGETNLRLAADYLSFTSLALALIVIAKNVKK